MSKIKVSKSEAIRKIIKEQPEATANDVVALLKKRGTEVSANLVYIVKATSKVKSRRKLLKEQATIESADQACLMIPPSRTVVIASNAAGDPVAVIRNVKRFAEEVGGLGKLKALVEAIAE